MIYHNKDGRHPSVLVEDGETLKLSAKDAKEIGIPLLEMRPRTTAALLVLAGRPPPQPPLLSDPEAFQYVKSTEGLTRLSQLDDDGKIDGYSVPFIRRVLTAFDPKLTSPPISVQWQITPMKADGGCDCYGNRPSSKATKSGTGETVSRQPLREAAAALEMRSVREVYVPEFISQLKVYELFIGLGDIVVGRNATLILDSDISFATADNFFAYKGARIVQQADYVNMNIKGRMRGGILSQYEMYTVRAAHLEINWDQLSRMTATKP